MDVSCEVIRDLIPLFVADDTGEETALLVSEHLRKCESCAAYFCEVYDEAEQMEKWGSLWPVKQSFDWLRDNRKRLLKGAGRLLCIGLLLAALWGGWWGLTQIDCIPVAKKDYQVVQALQLQDGGIYCEYSSRYPSTFTHHYVLSNGKVYFTAMRPVLDLSGRNKGNGKWIMDPDSVWDKAREEYIAVDAIYLGNPEYPEDATLVWERGTVLPVATDQEQAEIDAVNWTIF